MHRFLKPALEPCDDRGIPIHHQKSSFQPDSVVRVSQTPKQICELLRQIGRTKHAKDALSKLKLQFQIFDKDNSGCIGAVAFGTALSRWGLLLKQQELDSLFASQLVAGRCPAPGRLDYRAFVNFLFPLEPHPEGHLFYMSAGKTDREPVETTKFRSRCTTEELVQLFLAKLSNRIKGHCIALNQRNFLGWADPENTGDMSVKDFHQIMQSLGINPKEEELADIVAKYGVDGGKGIRYRAILDKDESELLSLPQAPFVDKFKPAQIKSMSLEEMKAQLQDKILLHFVESTMKDQLKVLLKRYAPIKDEPYLDLQGFIKVMSGLSFTMSDEDAQRLFYDCCAKGERMLPFSVFLDKFALSNKATGFSDEHGSSHYDRVKPIKDYSVVELDATTFRRMLVEKMHWKINISTLKSSWKARDSFMFFDSNRDGFMTWKEFARCMQSFGIHLNDGSKKQIYPTLPTTIRNGEIDYLKLIAELEDMEPVLSMPIKKSKEDQEFEAELKARFERPASTPCPVRMWNATPSSPQPKETDVNQLRAELSSKVFLRSPGGINNKTRYAIGMDTTADGMVTKELFKEMGRKLGMNLGCDRLFESYDHSGTGEIDNRELLLEIQGHDFDPTRHYGPDGAWPKIGKQPRRKNCMCLKDLEKRLSARFSGICGTRPLRKLKEMFGVGYADAPSVTSRSSFHYFLKNLGFVGLKEEEIQTLIEFYRSEVENEDGDVNYFELASRILLPELKMEEQYGTGSHTNNSSISAAPTASMGHVKQRPLLPPDRVEAILRTKVMERFPNGEEEQQLRRAFRYADTDNDGYITKNEFVKVAQHDVGGNLNLEEITQFFYHATERNMKMSWPLFRSKLFPKVVQAGIAPEPVSQPSRTAFDSEAHRKQHNAEECIHIIRERLHQKFKGPISLRGIRVQNAFGLYSFQVKGCLTKQEMHSACVGMGVHLREEEIASIFSLFGEDGMSLLNINELIDRMMPAEMSSVDIGTNPDENKRPHLKTNPLDNPERVFRMFAGKLEAKCRGKWQENIRLYLKRFDCKGSNTLDPEEFLRMTSDNGIISAEDAEELAKRFRPFNADGSVNINAIIRVVEGLDVNPESSFGTIAKPSTDDFSKYAKANESSFENLPLTADDLQEMILGKLALAHTLRAGTKSPFTTFKFCDLDGDGKVTLAEFQKGLIRIGIQVSNATSAAFFARYDHGDGLMSLHEMLLAMEAASTSVSTFMTNAGASRPSSSSLRMNSSSKTATNPEELEKKLHDQLWYKAGDGYIRQLDYLRRFSSRDDTLLDKNHFQSALRHLGVRTTEQDIQGFFELCNARDGMLDIRQVLSRQEHQERTATPTLLLQTMGRPMTPSTPDLSKKRRIQLQKPLSYYTNERSVEDLLQIIRENISARIYGRLNGAPVKAFFSKHAKDKHNLTISELRHTLSNIAVALSMDEAQSIFHLGVENKASVCNIDKLLSVIETDDFE